LLAKQADGAEQISREGRVNILVGTGAAREGGNRFLTEQRLGWYATLIALSYAIMTIVVWPVLHSGNAGEHCLDFNWIWLTGKLASANAAAQVYDPSAPLPPEAAALPQFHCVGTPGNGRFDYPPTVLFFTYPLGFMSYSIAMGVWNAATLLLYLTAVYVILPRPAAVIAALTTYPVVLNILIGHNGFLTAGLFGLALAFMERKPWLSGCFLGLLTYKPQFGILFPFALLASRNWRAFIGASAASVVFGAAAAIAFGYDLWPWFVTGMMEAGSQLNDHHSASKIVFPTVRGILQHMNFSAQTSWAAQGVVTAALVAAICALWSRPIPNSLKTAALGVAALSATPYALSYDYCILSIAVAFLVKDGLARGFLRGEQPIILVCWGGFSFFAFVGAIFFDGLTRGGGVGEPFVYFFLAAVPLIICATLFSIVVRRAMLIRPTREPVHGLRPRVSSNIDGELRPVQTPSRS
jgi:arabinofuranan 3-O-arabinosyltransferase